MKIKVLKYDFCIFICLICCAAFSQELVIKKDVAYGEAADLHNNMVNLKLDILYPSNAGKLPLIVYAHGGGFMKGSSKESHLPFCERLARNQFVVANIEYRTGFDVFSKDFKTEISKAVYRAEQDQIAAARYLVHHASEYSIDTSLVFIAGESAGAVASLFTAYVSQEDWDQAVPVFKSSFGSINNSGNGLNDAFRIRGVISMWGGIADTAFISNSEMRAMPVLLFHSMDDAEIPFERASHLGAKQQLLLGSRDIASRFKNNNSCYQLNFVKGAGHAYGFSGDYLSATIGRFVSNIREGRCKSSEIENKSRNISLSFLDSDEAAFPDDDDKIIQINAETLQQYAGRYEGNGTSVTMIVEGDHLCAQAGNDSSKLYPIGNNVFLEKRYNLRIEFVKDAEGKIREQILRLTKHKELHFKKME